VKEATLQTPRSLKKEQGRGAQNVWSRETSLAAHDEDHDEAGCSPAAHGGPWWSRSPSVAHGRDPTPEQMDV